jgi:hypothetical protein
VLALLVIGALCGRALAAAEDEVLQADRSLLEAIGKSDATALRKLLDPRFTWIDAQGRTLIKKEVRAAVPKPADQSGAEPKLRLYGRVALVTSMRDNVHVMRIWAHRARGWKALVYQEVAVTPASGSAAAAGAPKDCDNPCKTIPYRARSSDERGIIESWQALESAVAAGKGADWASHVADEFVLVDRSGALTKKQRIAAVNQGASAPPSVVLAKMFYFENAVVMTAQLQPVAGKPIAVSRIWVKQDANWQMAVSYQTVIQDAPAQTQ